MDLIMNEIKRILSNIAIDHIETSTKKSWEKRGRMLTSALKIPMGTQDYHKIMDAHLAAGQREIETITTLFNTIDSVLRKYVEENIENEISVDIKSGKNMH